MGFIKGYIIIKFLIKAFYILLPSYIFILFYSIKIILLLIDYITLRKKLKIFLRLCKVWCNFTVKYKKNKKFLEKRRIFETFIEYRL